MMTSDGATIVYEDSDYFATTGKFGRSAGFVVWRAGITHATKIATIGYIGEEGLRRVKAVIAAAKAIAK
jgi:hypothetical protein